MSREALLVELFRVLDLGEPLLAVFPKHLDHWSLVLPDGISPEMRWYADSVAWRAEDRFRYRGFRQRESADYLVGLVEDFGVGLLGWRAIGVLK